MSRMSPWRVTTDPMILRRVGKTGEEANELGAVACRIVIQGIDEVDPSSGKTNRQRFFEELADVQAQINCSRRAFLIDADAFEDRVARKESDMADWEQQMQGEQQ